MTRIIVSALKTAACTRKASPWLLFLTVLVRSDSFCDCLPGELLQNEKLLPEAFFRSPLESTVVYMTYGPGWLTPNGCGKDMQTQDRHACHMFQVSKQRPSAGLSLAAAQDSSHLFITKG